MPLMSILILFLLSWTKMEVKASVAMDLPLPDHALWTAELKKYVTPEGVVDYSTWKKNQGPLDTYLAQISIAQPVSNWSKNVQLSYWLNLYNAYTVKLILDYYPVRSIKDINNGDPWDLAWIHIGTKTYSLKQIENDIIRLQFREPRIHFALNCGARSCPPLLNEAYDPVKLEAQLTACTQSFIQNTVYNQTSEPTVHLSAIFDWYVADFGPDFFVFLNKYTSSPINAGSKIEYLAFDWSINDK